MRVVVIAEHGGPEVLEVHERPDPAMAPGHVRYRLLRPGGRLVAYGASSLLPGERRRLHEVVPHAALMWRGFDLIKQ